MRYTRSIVTCLFVIGGVLQLPMTASADPGLAVAPIGGTVTANSLASALVGSGVTVSNVSYTGANPASGEFSGGTGVIGFESGIVLTSGSAEDVVGPNASDSQTTINNTAGDSDLEAIQGVGAGNSYDAAVLQFDFTPNATPVFFNFVFASEEYNEYANTQYNDVFAFFVNGSNCAKVPNTSQPVSVNNVNGGNPVGTAPQNPQYFINNDPSDTPNANLDTQMDGLTTVLTCRANVNAGQSNHIKLAIADTGDGLLDSAVFLQANSFSTIPPTGVISGKVVNDANGNAVDDSEPGLSGAVVNLYADNTDGGTLGVFDGSDPQVGGSFTTGADGTWAFVNLDPGTYWAVETDPSGYVSTNAIAGTNGATKETVDRIKVVLPASSSSTGNKFLDVHTSNNTQDFAAGFCSGTTTCTISTDPGTGPTATDPTVSTIVIPDAAHADPQTITMTETSGATTTLCGGGPCQGQILEIISSAPVTFSGVDDQEHPVILTMIFDKTIKQGTKVYVKKGSVVTVVRNCTTPGIAAPRPCVSEKNILVAGGDRAFIILFLEGDPTIGKR